MELVRGTNKTEIKNAHRQEHIRRRQQDTPQAEICPEEAAERSQAEICPEQTAGYSTGRDMSGGGSRILHRQRYVRSRQQNAHRQRYVRSRQQNAHRQRYVRSRQQDAP